MSGYSISHCAPPPVGLNNVTWMLKVKDLRTASQTAVAVTKSVRFVHSSLSSFVRSSLSSFVRSFVRSFVVVVRLFVVAFVCCRCLRSFVRCLRSFVRSCVYLSFPLFAVADFVCCRCLRMWSLPSYVVVLSRVRRRYLPFVRRCCRRYHVIFARCRCRWMSLRRKDAVYVSVTLFGAFGHLC